MANLKLIPEDVRNRIDKLIEKIIEDEYEARCVGYDYIAYIACPESATPIERVMFLSLRYLSKCEGIKITPQFQISGYRVDFLLEWIWEPDNSTLERIIIECDGHDFHEKTKEQAQKDKKRDRDLQGLGFPVLRFTGSEIWRDPLSCATEAIEQLRDRASKAYGEKERKYGKD